jgi:hypothetical protein
LAAAEPAECTERMTTRESEPTLPALDLLQCVVTHGADGVSQRALYDDGWTSGAATRLLDALRSRGYVRFDRVAGHWVATEDGVRRADGADRATWSWDA